MKHKLLKLSFLPKAVYKRRLTDLFHEKALWFAVICKHFPAIMM